MRRRKRQSEGSLDSLLDTMTNVVGILVIVLVITQLGVSEAVRRIQANLPEVSPQRLADMQAQQQQAAAALASLQTRADDLARPLSEQQIDELWTRVDALREQANEAERQRTDPAPLQKQLADQRKTLQQLDADVTRMEQALTDARAVLATAMKEQPPAAKVVSLPNPRAAPQGAAEETFFCYRGRIVHVPLDGLLKYAEARIKQLQLPTDDQGRVDCARAVELFNRGGPGNAQFRLEARVLNENLYLFISPREGVGQTADELLDIDSASHRAIRALARRNGYATFHVWSDSYDAYLAARAVAQDYDVPAGWSPYHPNHAWRTRMPGGLKCIQAPLPVRPPQPQPQPRPDDRPVIPPPPTPPKPVPNDDID